MQKSADFQSSYLKALYSRKKLPAIRYWIGSTILRLLSSLVEYMEAQGYFSALTVLRLAHTNFSF